MSTCEKMQKFFNDFEKTEFDICESKNYNYNELNKSEMNMNAKETNDNESNDNAKCFIKNIFSTKKSFIEEKINLNCAGLANILNDETKVGQFWINLLPYFNIKNELNVFSHVNVFIKRINTKIKQHEGSFCEYHSLLLFSLYKNKCDHSKTKFINCSLNTCPSFLIYSIKNKLSQEDEYYFIYWVPRHICDDKTINIKEFYSVYYNIDENNAIESLIKYYTFKQIFN
jgi:hypothetical protein